MIKKLFTFIVLFGLFASCKESEPLLCDGDPICDVLFFPNPVETVFTISFNSSQAGQASFDMVTLSGIQLFQENYTITEGNNSFEINIEGLSNGIYNGTLTVADESQHLRIVKK